MFFKILFYFITCTMSELIYHFIKLKSYVQLYHWKTTNYERHVASGNLYSELDKKIDRFIEIFQGSKRINVSKNLVLKNITDAILLETLDSFVAFFYSQKLKSDLSNLRDDIVGDIHHTLYLFSLM